MATSWKSKVLALMVICGVIVFFGERRNQELRVMETQAQKKSDAYREKWFAACEEELSPRECHVIAALTHSEELPK